MPSSCFHQLTHMITALPQTDIRASVVFPFLIKILRNSLTLNLKTGFLVRLNSLAKYLGRFKFKCRATEIKKKTSCKLNCMHSLRLTLFEGYSGTCNSHRTHPTMYNKDSNKVNKGSGISKYGLLISWANLEGNPATFKSCSSSSFFLIC